MSDTTVSSTVLLILKIIGLTGIGVYAIFAAVMVQQVRLMINVLEDRFEPVLRILSLVHLAAAVGLFFLAIILL